MYSDSIKKRQQELLGVLFKKASGRSEATFIKSAWPQPTGDQLDILRRTLTPEGHAAVAQEEKVKKERALEEEYQRLVAEYKSNNPNDKFTEVTKSNLRRNAERNVKDRSVQESYKQMEQARLRSMVAPSPSPSAPTKPSAEGAVSLPKPKVDTPNPVDVGEVDLEDVGYDDSGIQFPGTPDILPLPRQTQTSTPTPTTEGNQTSTPTPTTEGNQTPTPTPTTEGNQTPTPTPITEGNQTPATGAGEGTNTPGGSQGGSENNGGGGTTNQPPAVRPELDWNKVLKGLIEKLKRHKITGIGGLGGFGLGALIGGGGSFTDRLLWALLGGGAGTGLGYLVEKYLK